MGETRDGGKYTTLSVPHADALHTSKWVIGYVEFTLEKKSPQHRKSLESPGPKVTPEEQNLVSDAPCGPDEGARPPPLS